MKKVVAIALFLTAVSGVVFAQQKNPSPLLHDKSPKLVYLKLYPMAVLASQIPGTGELRGGLEVVLSHKVTAQVNAGYLYKSPLFPLIYADTSGLWNAFKFPGYRFQGQARYYYLKLNNQKTLSQVFAPSGLYIALHASYAQASLIPKVSFLRFPRVDFSHVNITSLMGLQLLYRDQLGVDLFCGLGYKQNTVVAFDFFGNKTVIPATTFGGDFYASPVKVMAGIGLTLGLF